MKISAKEVNKALKLESLKNKNLTFNEIRLAVAMERVAARLRADEELAEHLIFKGGFVLFKLYDINRFTRDIDALGYKIEKNIIKKRVPIALSKNLSDGFWFGDIQTVSLDEQGEYGGIRFEFRFHIGELPENKNKIKKLSKLHFDVGFGNVVDAKEQKLISILSIQKTFSWLVYPIEFIYSEKLQTVIGRRDVNSRAKDIYDLVNLFVKSKDKQKLKDAINRTFMQRSTNIPNSFKEVIQGINPSLIEGAWNSVHILTDKIEFKKVWETFIEQMEELDNIYHN